MGGLIPRIRQVCSRDLLGTSSRNDKDTRRGRGWNTHPDLPGFLRSAQSAAMAQTEDEFVMNHVVLTGQIAVDPQRDRSRDGEPVTILLVAFIAPDEKADGTAVCEVEVLDKIADSHRPKLRIGAPVLISGEMTGAGALWAKVIAVGETS